MEQNNFRENQHILAYSVVDDARNTLNADDRGDLYMRWDAKVL